MSVRAQVMEIIDGDTFKTDNTIRLQGVYAPELSERGGSEAKRKLASLIADKEVTYEEKARDTYGRILARVWVDSVDVNATMKRYLG